MKSIEQILDRAKKVTGSDAKTGIQCHATKFLVSNWRGGKCKPNDFAISRLADITGMDVRVIMAALNYENAPKEERDYWANFFEKVTGLPPATSENGDFLYIM